MSRFAQELESRMLLSVTPDQVAADVQNVSTAASAIGAALKTANSTFNADLKAIKADLKAISTKANKKSNGALLNKLTRDAKKALTTIKKDAGSLTGSGKKLSKKTASDLKALLKKPGNAKLQAKVAHDVASLGGISTSRLMADFQSLALGTDLTSITLANPGSGTLSAHAQTSTGDFSAFSTTLIDNATALVAKCSTLATDANSVPTTTGVASIVGTFNGDAITRGGPNDGNVHFLNLVITSQTADGTLAGTATLDIGTAQYQLSFTGHITKDTTPYSDAIVTGTMTDTTTPSRGLTLTAGNIFNGNTFSGTYTGAGGIENAEFTLSKE